MVGPEVGRFSGGLANRGDTQCVEDVKQVWKFADGSGWTMDPLLQAQCEKDQSGETRLGNECHHFWSLLKNRCEDTFLVLGTEFISLFFRLKLVVIASAIRAKISL